ncbi:15956_t:CDS:1, partial [Racocetra persica]
MDGMLETMPFSLGDECYTQRNGQHKVGCKFFLYATEDEYNFLIKKLLGEEFSNFSNIK